jgi:hypothetical protein
MINNEYDKEFIKIFNGHYPFERYVVKTPQSIGNLFDDVLLVEVFVPNTEIKLEKSERGNYGWTCVDNDKIYVKIKGTSEEIRIGYFDFEEHIRQKIRDIVINDMGDYTYESLYVDHDDEEKELLKELNNQYHLIKEKYGDCTVKGNCCAEYAIEDDKVQRLMTEE